MNGDDLRREHMRKHLTDGRWHDLCRFCLRRRERGGDGTTVNDYDAAAESETGRWVGER